MAALPWKAKKPSMRFWIYSSFTVLWFVMWWYVYTCHIKSCCSGSQSDVRVGYIEDTNSSIQISDTLGNVISDYYFAVYRDSLLALLVDDNVLMVRGVYGPGETREKAVVRAQEVLVDFAPTLDTSRYRISARRHSHSPRQWAEVWVSGSGRELRE